MELENFKSEEPCVCCKESRDGFTCYHHLYTKKAYSEHKFNKKNLISVCFKHHVEFHQKGTSHMAEKYPGVRNWLGENGWYFCDVFKKWKNNNL